MVMVNRRVTVMTLPGARAHLTVMSHVTGMASSASEADDWRAAVNASPVSAHVSLQMMASCVLSLPPSVCNALVLNLRFSSTAYQRSLRTHGDVTR